MKPKKRRKLMKQIKQSVNLRGLDRIQVEWQQDWGDTEEKHKGILLKVSTYNFEVREEKESNVVAYRGSSYLQKSNIKKVKFSLISKENKVLFDISVWKDAVDLVHEMMGELFGMFEQMEIKLDEVKKFEGNLRRDSKWGKLNLGSRKSAEKSTNYYTPAKKKHIFFMSSDWREPEDDEGTELVEGAINLEDDEEEIDFSKLAEDEIKREKEEEPRDKATEHYGCGFHANDFYGI